MSVPQITIFFDLDGVLANWDKRKDQGYDPDSPGFYLALEPFDQGIELFKRLVRAGHQVLIASTPSWDNPSSWTEKRLWVEEKLGADAHKRLVLTHRKDLLIGDFLIDDRTKNGAGEFLGKLILFGSSEFPDWSRVEAFLLEKGLL
jgi:5'(3')-deoxyribonucleotidase